MRKWIGRFGGSVLLVAALGIALDALTYSPSAWIADYQRLKRDMAQGYANLDWMVQRRGLDLVALDRVTTERLQGARSRARAYLALRDFVAAFRDPHLEIAWGGAGGGRRSQAGAARPACGRAGQPAAFHAGLTALPGWEPLPSSVFALARQGPTGFLRLPSFDEDNYRDACRTEERPGQTERQRRLSIRALLQEQLRADIARLRSRGVRRLVIDLTGNGGGSDWATEAAALFSSKPLRRRERLLVGPECDRSAVWRGDPPPCSVFATPSAEFADLAGTGAWDGPLLILADEGTASAAEDFIVWLHGSGAATLIGRRTLGAGCGYVDGGTATRFTVAPITVRMPNCARYLADGLNEVEGVRPDVVLPMYKESFTRAFAQVLGTKQS
jgi:hypothetical protein